MQKTDPFQTPDAAALTLARDLLGLGHAALAFVEVETGGPGISRIALGRAGDGGLVTLVSDLAAHGPALAANPACALMFCSEREKGDPLTHPRLMLRAMAEAVHQADRPALRQEWLKGHPKAALYVDFADFRFVRLRVVSALLNAGFGKAFRIAPDALLPG